MLTPCLGRAAEQALAEEALDQSRWLCFVGPPGSGKSLCARHLADRRTALAWVYAGRLGDVSALARACLSALGAHSSAVDPGAQLWDELADRAGVVVVDAVDPELGGLAEFIDALLDRCRSLIVVVTSTRAIGHPRERVVRIGPLELPPNGGPGAGPAVELFRVRFEGAGGRAGDLVDRDELLRSLLATTGGLPALIEQLAIQTALVGIDNVVPTAAISEAVHAAYARLLPSEQQLFRRLALLGAPVTLDVVAEVGGTDRGEASAIVTTLVGRGLLELGLDGRFEMLAPMRRHGSVLAAAGGDGERAREALLRWAEGVTATTRGGAADAPWLTDLPLIRAAIEWACARPETRERGQHLANRIFPAMYPALRYREALEIIDGALAAAEPPAEIGAQLARRAGIAACETGGTFEGLHRLHDADVLATRAPDPVAERARNSGVRAEVLLDAGRLDDALGELTRALERDIEDVLILRQMWRTLADVQVCRGDFVAAHTVIDSLIAGGTEWEERWTELSGRTLLGRIALERGNVLEAAAVTRAAYEQAKAIGEDRLTVMAETLLRQIDPRFRAAPRDPAALPWSLRLGVLCQDARDRVAAGEFARAATLAADALALADGARLGKDAVEAALLLAHTLVHVGDLGQAETTYLAALERAMRCPLPLRAADALDGLAALAARRGLVDAPVLAAAAAALRATRRAKPWGGARSHRIDPADRACPAGWIESDQLTDVGFAAVTRLLAQPADGASRLLETLTRAEHAVALKVADGLTNREIAAALHVSARTVETHLEHIYRKLDINSRTRLAAILAGRA